MANRKLSEVGTTDSLDSIFVKIGNAVKQITKAKAKTDLGITKLETDVSSLYSNFANLEITKLEMVCVSVTESLSPNWHTGNITKDIKYLGFKNVLAVIPYSGGWLTPSVLSFTNDSFVYDVWNWGDSSHTGGGNFVIIGN